MFTDYYGGVGVRLGAARARLNAHASTNEQAGVTAGAIERDDRDTATVLSLSLSLGLQPNRRVEIEVWGTR